MTKDNASHLNIGNTCNLIIFKLLKSSLYFQTSNYNIIHISVVNVQTNKMSIYEPSGM